MLNSPEIKNVIAPLDSGLLGSVELRFKNGFGISVIRQPHHEDMDRFEVLFFHWLGEGVKQIDAEVIGLVLGLHSSKEIMSWLAPEEVDQVANFVAKLRR